MKLILASSSPRRAEILRDAGISFEVCATHVDEVVLAGESAQAMVARLSEAKARAIALKISFPTAQGGASCVIIGADTAVECDGKIFGKPRDIAHACEMLTALSGRKHQVHTGIFVLRLPDGAARGAIETTSVRFSNLQQCEVETYAATGEPLGKAGAYAIQGRAGCFIPEIEGCYFNVVGLPLSRMCELLGDLGWRR